LFDIEGETSSCIWFGERLKDLEYEKSFELVDEARKQLILIINDCVKEEQNDAEGYVGPVYHLCTLDYQKLVNFAVIHN